MDIPICPICGSAMRVESENYNAPVFIVCDNPECKKSYPLKYGDTEPSE